MPEIFPTGHEVILGSGKILELISFEVEIGEKKKMFERARRPPGVRVIIMRDREILLSREYRRELGKYDYRLPGGKVYDTLDEMRSDSRSLETATRDAVIRESQEEAGIVIRDPELIHISRCGANIEWDLYYFLVRDFDETGEHDRDDEGEADLTTAWYSFEEVRAKILSDEMSEDRSVAVVLKWILTH